MEKENLKEEKDKRLSIELLYIANGYERLLRRYYDNTSDLFSTPPSEAKKKQILAKLFGISETLEHLLTAEKEKLFYEYIRHITNNDYLFIHPIDLEAELNGELVTEVTA